MLGLGDYGSSDDDDDKDEEPSSAVCMPTFAAAATNDVSDSDSDEDDDTDQPRPPGAPAAEAARQSDSAAASSAAGTSSSEVRAESTTELPSAFGSADDLLDSVEAPSFLTTANDAQYGGNGYGSVLEESDPVASKRAAPEAEGSAPKAPRSQPPPEAPQPLRKSETTREKNKRKQKLGQANFSLKWDRDCGHEMAGL